MRERWRAKYAMKSEFNGLISLAGAESELDLVESDEESVKGGG